MTQSTQAMRKVSGDGVRKFINLAAKKRKEKEAAAKRGARAR